MSVVAKFYVQDVERPEGSSTASRVTLGAVCRGVENAMWSQYTPSGNITMGVLNDQATDYFKPGEEYLVTFQRVTRPTRGDGHQPKPVQDKHGATVCETCGIILDTDPKWLNGQDPDEYRAKCLANHQEQYGSRATQQ